MMTDLDIKLQEMALLDFHAFCEMGSVDKRKASVCYLRANGMSYGQIAIKLSIPRSTARNIVHKCNKKQPKKH